MRVGILVSVLALIVTSGSASGDVIYSDFGAVQSYNNFTGDAVAGPSSVNQSDQSVAASFTPSTSATLGSISLGVNYESGTNSFNFALTTDASGLPSTGTALKRGRVSPYPAPVGSPPSSCWIPMPTSRLQRARLTGLLTMQEPPPPRAGGNGTTSAASGMPLVIRGRGNRILLATRLQHLRSTQQRSLSPHRSV